MKKCVNMTAGKILLQNPKSSAYQGCLFHDALCLPLSSSVSIWAAIVSSCHLHLVPCQEVHAIIKRLEKVPRTHAVPEARTQQGSGRSEIARPRAEYR